MKYRDFDASVPYFRGVAMALIVCGAAITAIGLVEWILNAYGRAGFAIPSLKLIGGLVVTALGYIHLELELLRVRK